MGVKEHRKQIPPFETRVLVAGLTIKRIFLRIKGLGKCLGRITSGFATGFGSLGEDSDEFKKSHVQIRLDFSLCALVCLRLGLQFAGNYSVN